MPRKRSNGGWPRPTTQGKLLRELAEVFELPEPPKRIEVYDNSHIMGTNATGAMIVAGPEGFRKNAYRKFNIKSGVTPGDDFGMMREVLERRFARLEKEDPDRTGGEWPDLLLIDGGKGQLSAVCEVIEEAGVTTCPWSASPRDRTAMPAARCSILPGGREVTFPPNARCSSISSGCATRPIASPSARIARSGPRA